MIIGRPTIRQHKLLSEHFQSQISNITTHTQGYGACQPCNSITIRRDWNSARHLSATYYSKPEYLATFLYQKKEIINSVPIDQVTTAPCFHDEWNDNDDLNNNSQQSIIIEGPSSLQDKLRLLCKKYKHIFSETISSEPARVPPMDITVDETKWHKRENRLPPRVQSIIKQDEIHRQTSDLILKNVLEPTQEAYYSQVLLTPKAKDKWRFCIDFRRLNEATEELSWPLPNIPHLLRRIGTQQPKYFGVMDLTSGYHQIAISKRSRKYTAFITFMGVFNWLRVPMGLKGAAAYFQQMMATIVLAGLLYIILELYLDDIIVYGKTEDEFVSRLTLVFERLSKFNISLNPNKCRFGLQQVEYVGHLINDNSISFTREKLDKALHFRQLNCQKDLKQFLGSVNYFRSHIKTYAIVTSSLHKLVSPYKPRKAIIWTPMSLLAIDECKKLIDTIPTLFYIDTTLPVYVETDASDYGIGAWIFQLKENHKYPIAFLSKTLIKEQLRWSVPEKECYAIVYSLKKWEYLLRDIHFKLYTDHKNLTYLDAGSSAKVYRWKLEVQEYDFEILPIKGDDNIVADALSRLCEYGDNTESINLLDEFQMAPAIKQKIAEAHNEIVGHGGLERTLNKLLDREAPWPQIREHVKWFIRHCPCCQLMTYIKYPIHTHPFTTGAYEPFERVNIDTIGPLPVDSDGNAYIIVIIDCFSRFVELYPAKDATGKSAALALINTMGRFGNSNQILSDRGPQFVNNLIKEYLQFVGVEHVTTMAYSKEENSIVERANRETGRHLRAIIFHKNMKATWSQALPLVQRIMNSNTIATIGVSPAQILFGNAINLDRGIFIPHLIPNQDQIKLSDWLSNMLQAQANAIAIAQATQNLHDKNHYARSSTKRTEFEINSYVLAQYEELDHKPPNKLMVQYKGPYRIVNYNGNIYTVKNLVDDKLEDYHITNLRPFHFDNNDVDPRDIANKVLGLVDVESILKHKGNKKYKKNMQFLVKWTGFDNKHNQWLLWKDVRNLQVLHLYLINNHMSSLIPNQFKHN